MTSDQTAAIEQPAASRGRSRRANWLILLGLALVANIAAFVFFPPFDKDDPTSGECPYPVCYINGTLEAPNPYIVWDLSPETAPEGLPLIQFHPSISASIFTMWIITALMVVGLVLMTRRRDMIPGRAQNVIEAIYDGLQGFAMSLGGPAARKYVPLFVTLFIYILASNWSGLLPFVGRIHEFRAPTSDVNITVGLALVSFAFFHIEGIRALGVGGYLSKFFPLREFRNGVGAGIIALFVGLVELMLEFVKPLTLSMRLFGNIYGGEVALGVILALTIAFVPVFIYGLELMLNLVQALIFSVLTLMFILAAIEGHHEDEPHHAPAEPTATPIGPDTLDQVATAH
ncbi:MAG: F0F1 ATP synthase subunit A [Candidatus Limnocylindria bacterium]